VHKSYIHKNYKPLNISITDILLLEIYWSKINNKDIM